MALINLFPCTQPLADRWQTHARLRPSQQGLCSHMVGTQPPMNPPTNCALCTMHCAPWRCKHSPSCMHTHLHASVQMHVQIHMAMQTTTCTQHSFRASPASSCHIPAPPGLPEEEQADVCSVTICVLLDPIIISITPSTHPWSSANWDGWSLLPTSRGAGVPHSSAGDAECWQQMGCRGEWVAEGLAEPRDEFPLRSMETQHSSPFPAWAAGRAPQEGAEHRVGDVPQARGAVVCVCYYFGSARVK